MLECIELYLQLIDALESKKKLELAAQALHEQGNVFLMSGQTKYEFDTLKYCTPYLVLFFCAHVTYSYLYYPEMYEYI